MICCTCEDRYDADAKINLEAKIEVLQGAVKAHALRFNDAAKCYYCIFCNAELGMGAIEHKEDCVVLLAQE